MSKVAIDEEVNEKEVVKIPLNEAQNGEKVDNAIPPIEVKQKDESSSICLPPIDRGYAWIIFLATTAIMFITIGTFRAQSVFVEPVRKVFNISYTENSIMISMSIIIRHTLRVGAALYYSPTVITLSRYFLKYRPLATGIAASGASLGTLILPLVLRWLMERMSFNWVVVITAVIGSLTALFGLLLRPIDPRALALLDEQQKQRQQQSAKLPSDEEMEKEKAKEGIVRYTIDKVEVGQQQGASSVAAAAASVAAAAAAGAKRMSPMQRASVAPRMRHNSASITSFDGFINVDKSLIEADNEPQRSPARMPPSPSKTSGPPTPHSPPAQAATFFRTQSESSAAGVELSPIAAPTASLPSVPEEAEHQTNGDAAASAATAAARSAESSSATKTKAIAKEEKKGVALALATGTDYFRAMPSLLCNVPFVVHALCYAVQLGCAVTVQLSLDSFIRNEIGGTMQLASVCMMAFAIGDLLGRILTGAVSSLPAFFPQVVEPPADAEAAARETCGRKFTRFLFVTALSPRAIYSASTWLVLGGIFAIAYCASTDVLSVVALYLVFAIGAGGETGQYAVVMVELVGVKRMAAAHALYTLLAGPIFATGPSLAGFIKDRSSWASAYCVLGVGYAVAAVIDSINLLVVVEYCRRRKSTARKPLPQAKPAANTGGETAPLTK